MTNKADVPTFFVHNETLARKKREEETEGKQRAARVGTWKIRKLLGFSSFHSFPYAQKMFRFIFSCILFYVSRFLFACFMLVCSLLQRILPMLFPVQIFVNNSQTTMIVCHFANNSRTNTFTHVGDIVTATKKCGTLKVIPL